MRAISTLLKSLLAAILMSEVYFWRLIEKLFVHTISAHNNNAKLGSLMLAWEAADAAKTRACFRYNFLSKSHSGKFTEQRKKSLKSQRKYPSVIASLSKFICSKSVAKSPPSSHVWYIAPLEVSASKRAHRSSSSSCSGAATIIFIINFFSSQISLLAELLLMLLILLLLLASFNLKWPPPPLLLLLPLQCWLACLFHF